LRSNSAGHSVLGGRVRRINGVALQPVDISSICEVTIDSFPGVNSA